MSSQEPFNNISFDLPKNQSNVIKVIGVGGGGSNAINHMFQQGIKGVDFVICNTDSQALENSPIPNKIQLGVSLTEGLGAGANPEVGEQAAVESYEEIKTMLDTNTKMIFITAGMGGGTGTGAAPIIAKMAKELDILTVGIVTIPFQFEGRMRNEQAQLGVEKLRSHVDSLVVINNNKLREVYGNLGFKAGFSKADEVLSTASRGIAEVITHHYTQNIDLRDAKTVLSNSGTAIMGSAHASGASRAADAIHKALDSPLLNDNKITGAKNVLLLIVSGKEEITIDEIGEINDHIQIEAGHGANIIMGVGEDESLEDAISVTVIATGFDIEQQDEITNTESKKIIHTLEDEQRATQNLSPVTTSINRFAHKKPTPTEPPVEPIIKHELTEDVEEEKPFRNGLIPTTQTLRNMPVIFEEIRAFNEGDNYTIINAQDIINKIEVRDSKKVVLDDETVEKSAKDEVEKEEKKDVTPKQNDGMTLLFDLPANDSNISEVSKDIESDQNTQPQSKEQEPPQEAPIRYNLVDDTEEIEVKDAVEIIPINETVPGGVRRYSLDDYMEEEEHLLKAKPKTTVEDKQLETADDEVVFERKTIAPESKKESEPTTYDENADPIDQPISEILKERAAERRAKMKEFNYKFRNSNSHIDDIEKEPAYKRAGLNVNDKPPVTDISRTSVSTDDNDDIQLRSNNSFLHDNVD